MKFILKFLDVAIPRFLREDVALVDSGDHYEIVCPMADLEPGGEYHAVATMEVFNFFGYALFPKMIGDVRPWPKSSEAGG